MHTFSRMNNIHLHAPAGSTCPGKQTKTYT